MSNIKFSIEELQRIRESKQYLTKERFIYYSQLRHELSEREAIDMFSDYCGFPFKTRKYDEKVLVIALDIFDFLWECWNNQMPYNGNNEKDLKKIFYIDSKGENSEIIVDFMKTEDILSYAEIIKGCVPNEKQEIKAIVRCIDSEYNSAESKDRHIFDGDIYSTHDNYWGKEKGNVYMALNGKIKRLLYIKGKGYLKNNEPNIDDEDSSFSTYAVFGKEFTYMGNAKIDINFLNDK